MALEFIDGFAHYTSSNIPQKWNLPGGTITATPPAGRLGPALVLLPSSGLIGVTLSYQDSWVIGFAANFSNVIFTSQALFSSMETAGQSLFSIRCESDQTVSIYTGNNGTLISNTGTGTDPFTVHQNTWYYFEAKFSFAGSTSSPVVCTAEMKIDGTVRAAGTKTCGFNTSGFLNPVAKTNVIQLGNQVNLGNTYIKDLYALTTTGATPNDYAGDCTFIYVVPDGDVTTNWTPSSGTVHFSLVNEVPPDGDASYVESTNPGDVDNYTWQDIPAFSGTIVGAQYLAFLRKTGEGKKSVKLTVGPSGSYVGTSQEFFLNDNYIYYRYPLGTDPATGSQWTQAGFNATDFGIIEVS